MLTWELPGCNMRCYLFGDYSFFHGVYVCSSYTGFHCIFKIVSIKLFPFLSFSLYLIGGY